MTTEASNREPGEDRIEKAAALAMTIKDLRDARLAARELSQFKCDADSTLRLAGRVDHFLRRFGDVSELGLKADQLLRERLLVIASQLERKVGHAIETAEARLKELFLTESTPPSSGRLEFRRVMDATRRQPEAWQQAAIDQVARDVGIESHPAGAEFSSQPSQSATQNVGLDVTASAKVEGGAQ